MPIYVYRCRTCGETFEEIQKVDAAAPDTPTEIASCPKAQRIADGSPVCDLERQLTTATHRFSADYTSDGIAGYQRQGEVMVRQVQGKSGEDYGSDRSGRS